MSLNEIADNYLNKGLSIIPLIGKKPVIANWQRYNYELPDHDAPRGHGFNWNVVDPSTRSADRKQCITRFFQGKLMTAEQNGVRRFDVLP